MSNSFLLPVSSKGTVNFLDALITGATTPVNAVPAQNLAVGSRRFLLRTATLVSKENLDYQFGFFASAAEPTADPDTNRFISQFEFFPGMGFQMGNAGLWYYYLDGLAVPYYMDGSGNSLTPPTLNVNLTNRSAAAKMAGAPGALALTCWFEPQSAQ